MKRRTGEVSWEKYGKKVSEIDTTANIMYNVSTIIQRNLPNMIQAKNFAVALGGKHMKRVIALILSLVMLLSLVPTTAWAEDMEQAQDDGASYEFAAAYVAEEDLGVSNEDLHAAYIQRVLDESVGLETPMPFRTSALKAGTLEKEIYDALKVELAKIAAGTRTSTEITISGLTGSWNAEDLGVEAIFDDTGLTEDARIAIFGDSTGNEKGILGVVYDCLLADCPLELYWHDKTIGVAFGGGIMNNDAGEFEFSSVIFSFYVATDYSVNRVAETFVTDSAKTKAAANAVETAQSIVDSYATKSNYDKLDAYRKIICDLVSYNSSAASGNSTTMGINPWQIIYVFDQDNTTNVVCEGYAKAFQYLCDLSTFLGDVECHTVSGEMDGVNHMWNVVTMEDGQNYLVDVTNCDSGTIGASDKLFMATTANTADSHQTHTFAIGSKNVVFTYGEDMADLFCDGYLALAVAPYGTEKQPTSVNVAGSNSGQAGETVGVVLRLSGTALMGLEAKLAYSDTLEFISCTAANNNWDIEYNEADGTLVANTATAPIFRDTELVSLKFRVKDTAAVGSNWNVTFSDITVSDGDADDDSLDPVSWTGKVIAAPVAKWGTAEEKFGEGTLQEALDAAESAEGYLFIDLLRDVTAAEPLTLSAGGAIGAIIDLCGYEIHGSFIVDGGALTVYNGAITAEGNVLTATEDATAIVVGDDIIITSTDGCGIYCDAASAVVEIHGEIISRSKGDETAAVYFNGSNLGMFGGFIEGEVCGLLVDGGNVIIADSQFIDESAPLECSAIRGETCGLVVNGGSVTVAKETEIRAAARGEAIGALVLGGELTVTNSLVRGAIGAALQGGSLTVDEESYIEGNTICGISVEEGTLNIADAAAVYGMAVGVLVQKGALTVENGAIVGGEIGLMLNGEETTATVSGAVYGYTDTAIFANGGTLTLGDIQLSGSVNYDDNGTFIGGGELYVGSDAKVYANEMFAPASDMVFRIYGADVASQQLIAPLGGAMLNAENFAYAGMGKVITKGDDGALYLGACDHEIAVGTFYSNDCPACNAETRAMVTYYTADGNVDSVYLFPTLAEAIEGAKAAAHPYGVMVQLFTYDELGGTIDLPENMRVEVDSSGGLLVSSDLKITGAGKFRINVNAGVSLEKFNSDDVCFDYFDRNFELPIADGNDHMGYLFDNLEAICTLEGAQYVEYVEAADGIYDVVELDEPVVARWEKGLWRVYFERQTEDPYTRELVWSVEDEVIEAGQWRVRLVSGENVVIKEFSLVGKDSGSLYFADEYNNPIDTVVLDYSNLEDYLYDIKLVGLDEVGTEDDRRLGISFWGDGAGIFDPVETESKEIFREVFGREVGKYGTILFDKPGTSTLQMFDVETGAEAELTIVAYYIDTAKKFTTKVDVPAYGLEVGMNTFMEVFGTDAENPLPAGKFTFTSSNESVATVGEHDGMIQAQDVGSATITATANEDPLKRKVTYKLTVVAPQAEYVTITPDTSAGEWKYRADSGAEYDDLERLLSLDETLAGPVLKLDAGTFADSFTFDFAYATNPDGVAVKVVSNNTKVAAVKDNKDGTVTVTIPANADGTATITVTAQDKRGAQANLFVQVRNYTPRFDTKKMTYNPALAGSFMDVPLVESYGASIDRDSIECIAVPKKGDAVTFESVEYDGSKLMIPVDESKLVDGAYTVTISGTYGENDTPFSYSFALTVKTAMPKVTVKQVGKFDLFNKSATANLVASAKGEVINRVVLSDPENFFASADVMGDTITVRYADSITTTKDTKVNLAVYVAGYDQPVAVSASVGTETKKPSLKLSASSVTVNTAMVEEGDAPTFSFVVTSKDGKVMRPMTELQESNITVNGDIASVDSVSNGVVVMKLLDEKGGKVAFDVQLDEWAQSVPLSITVKTSDKLPKVKLSSATLKLNNQFYQQEAATELVFDQSLGYSLDVEKTLDTIFSDSFVHEYGDIVFTMEGNVLKAKFWQDENSYAFVDKGSYNYKITPVLDDGTATGYALAPISFKVAVENTMPKAKFSTSAVKLNSSNLTAKREVATTVVTLPASYRLDGVLFNVDGYQTVVTTNEWTVIKGTNGVVKARLSDAIANGIAFSMATSATTEKFDIKCIPLASTADALEGEMVALAEAKLTVQIARDHKMSAAVSGKGKLDAVNRAGSYIEYTMTKLTGVQGQVSDVSLIGRDAALFTLSEMTYNAKGQPVARLQLREDAHNLSSKAQYEVALRYTLLGADGAQMWVESPVQKVKLSQTALKVTVAGNNAVVYQSQSNGMVEFTFISATAGVKIGNVTVGSKNDAVAKALLTDCQVQNHDGMVTVRIPIANAERLTAGKSINCTFDVTAVGHLSDAKVTSVKATFKMAK